MNKFHARIGGRRGFTLIEVLIALGLFAIGASALLSLFAKNLATAELAREEIILAMITKDVTAKNQLAAFTAGTAGLKTFGDAVQFSPVNQWLVGVEPDTLLDDVTLSPLSYNKVVAVDPANPTAAEKPRLWENIHMYRNFNFAIEVLGRNILEDNQYVDWDGYGIIREDQIGQDLNADGDTDDSFDFGNPAPSHSVEYDSTQMRYYIKRIKMTIIWKWRDPTNYATGADWFKGSRREIFYFPLYNPDLKKH